MFTIINASAKIEVSEDFSQQNESNII